MPTPKHISAYVFTFHTHHNSGPDTPVVIMHHRISADNYWEAFQRYCMRPEVQDLSMGQVLQVVVTKEKV